MPVRSVFLSRAPGRASEYLPTVGNSVADQNRSYSSDNVTDLNAAFV